jgi:aryl-alcohol dehydrogenase-like predicted oxidoreductase
MSDTQARAFHPARLGLGLAAIGRPAYITAGRAQDLGEPGTRSVDALRERAHGLLDEAWSLGIRYLDAARSYGDAEGFIGTWLARHPERRDDLVIGSKWGYEYVGGWRMDADVHERKDHGLAMFEAQWPATITALRTRPDLYLIHSVTPDSPALGDTALLDALRRLAETGVRIGISASGPNQADVIRRALALPEAPFSAVQATWNLLEPSAAPALAEAHAANWVVVVKEALANGRLAVDGDRADSDGADPRGAGSGGAGSGGAGGAGSGDLDARLMALAEAEGRSPIALALGAALAQPWASIVLSGAVTVEQLRENAAVPPFAAAAETLAPFAEAPEQYWADRQRRAWT